MSRLGILLACEHYPLVTADASKIDAQLRLWLAEFGAIFDEIRVYSAYEGELPRHGAGCDTWIASGVNLSGADASGEHGYALKQFLRAAAAFGRPIFAVNHAEHILHQALSAFDAPPPITPSQLRSIRNPFRSFLSRDQLHRFNPQNRTVESLARPVQICHRRLFGVLCRAA